MVLQATISTVGRRRRESVRQLRRLARERASRQGVFHWLISTERSPQELWREQLGTLIERRDRLYHQLQDLNYRLRERALGAPPPPPRKTLWDRVLMGLQFVIGLYAFVHLIMDIWALQRQQAVREQMRNLQQMAEQAVGRARAMRPQGPWLQSSGWRLPLRLGRLRDGGFAAARRRMVHFVR